MRGRQQQQHCSAQGCVQARRVQASKQASMQWVQRIGANTPANAFSWCLRAPCSMQRRHATPLQQQAQQLTGCLKQGRARSPLHTQIWWGRSQAFAHAGCWSLRGREHGALELHRVRRQCNGREGLRYPQLRHTHTLLAEQCAWHIRQCHLGPWVGGVAKGGYVSVRGA